MSDSMLLIGVNLITSVENVNIQASVFEVGDPMQG